MGEIRVNVKIQIICEHQGYAHVVVFVEGAFADVLIIQDEET